MFKHAQDELEHLPTEIQKAEPVLLIRCHISQEKNEWQEIRELAEKLVSMNPAVLDH